MKQTNRGEAYFLRAFFYFRLAQFFGEVPLDLNPGEDNLPKSSPEEIYSQITSDLLAAINDLPAVPFKAEDSGKVTKWAAEALMGRVFLFYTGVYGKNGLPTNEGKEIYKQEIIEFLVDCIENSGHSYLDSYASLWPFTSLGDGDDNDEGGVNKYPYAANLSWAGDGCIETIFAIKFNNQGGWGDNTTARANSNILTLASSPSDRFLPFGSGWGLASVNPDLLASFEDGDKRKISTIIDCNDPNEPLYNSYVIKDNRQYETGLFNKKYSSILVLSDPQNPESYVSMYNKMYGGNADMQTWNMQDEILIRYTDVLLMAAELGYKSQEYLDKVRERAGLSSVPYTLEALKNERRHEFALEGLRWFDLLRWGDAQEAIESSNGLIVKNAGVDVVYNVEFNPDRIFLPLPESQIRLSQGVLKQNPGWLK